MELVGRSPRTYFYVREYVFLRIAHPCLAMLKIESIESAIMNFVLASRGLWCLRKYTPDIINMKLGEKTMVPARSLQRPTLLSVAILAALLANSSAGMAATVCQAKQIKHAQDLIYQASSGGLIGCDSKEKKANTNNPGCSSQVEKIFKDSMDAEKKQPGCTFNFESQAVLGRWKKAITTFRDPDCRDQKCKTDGRKRRRASQMDLLYGKEARNLLNKNCSAGGKGMVVDPVFVNKVDNMLRATPGLLSPDNGSKRKENMLASLALICGDIVSKSAIKTTVDGEDIPGESAINLNAANNNPLVTTLINDDPSNLLKSAKNVDVQWGKNSPIKTDNNGSGSTYQVRIPAKDIVDDKQSCNVGSACDNQQVDLTTRFMGNSGLIYQENQKIWVDVVPPQSPQFPAPIESVTLNRANEIVAVVPANVNQPKDQLQVKGSVSGFRAASQTDNTFHNQAEASSATVTLGDCTSNANDCIEKKGSGIVPDNVGSWVPNQEFTATFRADELVKFSSIEGRVVEVSSYLTDAAGNQGGSATGKIKFTQEIPTVVSITPEGDQSCPSAPGVYNIKANVNSAGGIKVTLPDGIIDTDALVTNYGDTAGGDAQAVAGSPWDLAANQKEVRFPLTVSPVPNLDEQPQSPNATITAFLQNGNTPSAALSRDFFSDLKAPEKPTLSGDDVTETNGSGKVRVTLSNENDAWSIKSDTSTLCSSGDAESFTSIDNLTKECGFNLDKEGALPTFTATESDWACNEATSDPYTPGVLLAPEIALPLSSCNGVSGGVVNAVPDRNPRVKVTNLSYKIGDKLLVNPQQPMSYTVFESSLESGYFPLLFNRAFDYPEKPAYPNGYVIANVSRKVRDGFINSRADKRYYVDNVAPVVPSPEYGWGYEPGYSVCLVSMAPAEGTSDRVIYQGVVGDSRSQCENKSGTLVCKLWSDEDVISVRYEDWACNGEVVTIPFPCSYDGGAQ